ncbi:MAG: squalene synthase HpnC [Deltaproteobacteria bacterium]|nr:squalene synthase HpnC [Deltaproteobacteria bacterium]
MDHVGNEWRTALPGTATIGPWSPAGFRFHAGPWEPGAARRFCLAVARDHYENFPVMLSLFRLEVREALAAVYAFARTADDFADEPQFAAFREHLLDQWESQLDDCFAGKASHPVFIALGEAVRRFGLEIGPFRDLLSAFRQDCRKDHYDTVEDLLDYCRRSANPVGRIVLRVLGIDRPEFRVWSDDICTALQLANFWQDVSVDVRRGRLYLPLSDLERFAVRPEALLSGRPPPAFDDVVRFEVDRTRDLFRSGRPLVENTAFPEQLYFAGVWLGGRTVLRMVKDLGADVFFKRPSLGTGALALVWLRAAPEKLAKYGGGLGWIR